jgi:hypothetical protein
MAFCLKVAWPVVRAVPGEGGGGRRWRFPFNVSGRLPLLYSAKVPWQQEVTKKEME